MGGEQRKCPAWLIYAWSEEGSNVAWTKKNPNRKIKREYEKHRLDWWFTESYNNGQGVGSSWALLRGVDEGREVGSDGQWYIPVPHRGGSAARLTLDRVFVSLVGKTRSETLQRLRANADSQLNQVTRMDTTGTTNITSNSPTPY